MITVKDFFEHLIQDYEAELYGIVSNSVLNTTAQEMQADDGLREGWKNAEIECWWIDENNKSIVMEVYV